MQNPYYIQPADLTPGFQGLMQGFAKRGEFEREKAKETKNLKMRENLANLFKTGSPEDIGGRRPRPQRLATRWCLKRRTAERRRGRPLAGRGR